MKRNISISQFAIYSFIVLVFSACQYSKEPNTFSNKQVSIQFPSYLSESNDVYPAKNTLLQAKNDYRDVFFILVDHGQKPGNLGFEMMCDSIMSQLKKNMREPNIEANDSSFTIGNLKAKEFQISGVLSSEQQDHRFLFVIDVFEAPNGHIYQTAGWLLRHKRPLWLKDLQQAAYSIKIKE
ncbi:MAG: hypothetical protein R2807_08145 [Chitinophagales bacterium]